MSGIPWVELLGTVRFLGWIFLSIALINLIKDTVVAGFKK